MAWTIEELRTQVLNIHPDAELDHRRPGPNQYSEYWTIRNSKGEALGATALYGEADAWLYAARKAGLII